MQIRGSKALVLESFFIQPLGLVADAATLKDHGIDMYVYLRLPDFALIIRCRFREDSRVLMAAMILALPLYGTNMMI